MTSTDTLKKLLISTDFTDAPYTELTLQELIILKNSAEKMSDAEERKEVNLFLKQRTDFFRYLTIKRFMNLDEVSVIACRVTKLPYVVCDEDSLNDQVLFYSNNEVAMKAAKELQDTHKIPLYVIKIQKAQIIPFLVELFFIGVNEVVIDQCKGSNSLKTDLDKFVKKPDFTSLPDAQRKLMESSNPELSLTSIYFAQKNVLPQEIKNVEELKELEEEIIANLSRGKMILPLVTPKSEDGEQEDIKNSRVPLLKMKNEDVYLPVCSDSTEFMKANAGKYGYCIAEVNTIRNLCGENVKGIILNPATVAICIPKEKL